MKLSPTTRVVRSVLVASIAAFLFGFDTGTIGAVTEMPSFVETFGHFSSTVRGIVVASILLPSTLSGLVAGSVADRISRKHTIALGAAIFAVGQAVSCGSVRSLGMLIAARVVAGLGEGLFLGTVAVYVAEISPKEMRGRMMLVAQLAIASGVATGFFVCFGSARIASSLSWRLPFALSTFLALLVTLLAPLILPYSPRWLLLHNRRDEAERVLDLLVGTGDAVQDERRELMSVPRVVKGGKRAAFVEMWRRDVWWRTTLGALLQGMQQLSGIDFVLFFAATLFKQAGLSGTTSSLLAGGVTGVLIVLTTILTLLWVDRLGRRTIYIGGGCAISVTLVVIGAMYASGKAGTEQGKWVVVVMIELFAIAFSGSWAVITRLYASEIQPSKTRAAAASFSTAINQAINFVVALTGPVFLSKSPSGPYFTYGALTAFASLFAFFFMPETKNLSLESIDTMFSSHSPTASLFGSVPLAVPHPFTTHPSRRRSRRDSEHIPEVDDGEVDDETTRVENEVEKFRREVKMGGSAAEKAIAG
ncbi:hypothetical protein JCM10049v2_001037 [Rhodotorula toruloides]